MTKPFLIDSLIKLAEKSGVREHKSGAHKSGVARVGSGLTIYMVVKNIRPDSTG
jgi:hypothetical protein